MEQKPNFQTRQFASYMGLGLWGIILTLPFLGLRSMMDSFSLQTLLRFLFISVPVLIGLYFFIKHYKGRSGKRIVAITFIVALLTSQLFFARIIGQNRSEQNQSGPDPPFTFMSHKYGFKISFPRQPEMRQEKQEAVGKGLFSVVYSCNDKTGRYHVQISKLPLTPYGSRQYESILDKMVTGMKKTAVNARSIEKKSMTLKRIPGREIRIHTKKGTLLIARFYIKKGMLYQLGYLDAPGKRDDKKIKRFFNSFEFIKLK